MNARRLSWLGIGVALAASSFAQTAAPPLEGRLLDPIRFRSIGPSAPSGRVWQVIGVPRQPKTFYVCTAQAGFFRTTNFGATLVPIFDEENAASCGAVAVAPSDPSQIWVGSGEPAARQSNGVGYGVFQSTDGGKTWQSRGLQATQQIGAVLVHPSDPRTVYVAAMGHLWGRNPERGVFRTRDAGSTWEKVLYVDDVTGAIDLAMDPRDPNVLYASMWQRLRSAGAQMAESGPGSGIFKTTDGGDHWTRLSTGLPNEPVSKIEIEASSRTPGLLYAYILSGEPAPGRKRTSEAGGVFRSEDGGASWRRVNPKLSSRTYYTHLKLDPNDDRRLWIMDLELWRSDDGGESWVKHNMKNVHDDLHSLWIDPNDSENLVLGGDGGVSTSRDGGTSWVQTVLPLAQFYEVDVDDQDPYWVYGGMQDTASWSGPSQTYDHEGITDYDWIKLRSEGDGMAIHPDPRDPNIIYLCQEDGDTARLDLRTWTRTQLQPTDEDAKRMGLSPLRWDWSQPMIVSAADPDVIYLGSQYVFRCRMGEALPNGETRHTCEAISVDLTAQQDEPFPGVYEGRHSYGALYSLAESPVDPNVLWAGADDGPIHVSRDRGKTWTRVDPHLPEGSYRNGVVSKIEPSRTSAGAAYVTFDLHYLDDNRPYVFRTTDFGGSWTNLTHDLPEWGATYVIREDPHNPRVLYVGTESGLFVSIDSGGHWVRWKGNLPHTAVRSLVVQPRARDLVVGTFGRAIYIVDVSVVEQLEEALGKDQYLFEVEPAVAYNTRYTYGTGLEEVNGDTFFRGENPSYGATITYSLKSAASGPVRIVLSDASGKLVRTLEGSGAAGLHQVQWDLESDDADARLAAAGESAQTFSQRQRARRVSPGTYTATLTVSGAAMTRSVAVRAEGDGVRVLGTRK
jgi:photosystem II stability/assembly factor-like uncharacterized protein